MPVFKIRDNDRKLHEITGSVSGLFGIHHNGFSTYPWTVWHIPSGYAVVRNINTVSTAYAIIRELKKAPFSWKSRRYTDYSRSKSRLKWWRANRERLEQLAKG